MRQIFEEIRDEITAAVFSICSFEIAMLISNRFVINDEGER